MQKHAKYNIKPLDAKVAKDMALEAAAMEARLAELKLSMLQERARREAAMSAATAGGSIWTNGADGPIKLRAPLVQQPKPSPSPAALRAAKPSLQQPLPGRQPKPPGSSQDTVQLKAGKLSYSSCSSSRGSSADTAVIKEPATATPSISTIRHANGGRSGSREGTVGSLTVSSAPGWSDQVVALAAPHQSACSCDDPRSGSSLSGNASCSSSSNLLSGAYDEAAAGQSFQEALQAWRNAGACSSGSGNIVHNSSTNARHQPDTQVAGNQAELAAGVVQTDAQAEQRSAAATQSTGSATGSTNGSGSTSSSGTSMYFLRVLAGSRSSSSRSRMDRSTDSVAQAQCHGAPVADEDAGVLSGDVPTTDGTVDVSPATATTNNTTRAPVVAEAVDFLVHEASGNQPSSVPESNDWLTSMQGGLLAAEAAAAALASAAITPAAAAVANQSSDLCTGIPANRPATMPSAALTAYHQQLQMLEELELLEQQVQCAKATTLAAN